jgi:hypothetical protein
VYGFGVEMFSFSVLVYPFNDVMSLNARSISKNDARDVTYGKCCIMKDTVTNVWIVDAEIIKCLCICM